MSWMISPLSWLLLSGGLAVLAFWSKKKRLQWMFVILAFISMATMTPLFANTLVGLLESEAPKPASCRDSPPDTAVVLASGFDDIYHSGERTWVLNTSSQRRMDRAIQWWRQKQDRKLLLSGGSRIRGGKPVASVMEDYAREMGVPAHALLIESGSWTTWENAQFTARMPAVPKRVVLITSAMHMPRARYAMRRAGFDTCPIAADSRLTSLSFPGYLIPQSSSLAKTEEAMHELVGFAFYHFLGRRNRK